MTADDRDLASENIANRVCRSHWFHRASYLAAYIASPAEVDTWTIISRAWRMEKRVFAPVVEKKRRMQFRELRPDTDLVRNEYGLFEPAEGDYATARMLDLVLVPLTAFDRHNARIGMGGGYYDTTFSFLRHRTIAFRPRLIGLAFACQQVEKIPSNPWDIPLFDVVTESS